MWMAGKCENLAPMCKKLMKIVDIDEPTSFLDNVYLGCTQRECKPNEAIIKKYTKSSNHVLLLEQQRNCRDGKNHHAQTVAWSYDMEGRAQKCVERCCELANKKVEQLFKVSQPCLDDHQFKKEELQSVRELPEVCSNACTWHELDDLTSCGP